VVIPVLALVMSAAFIGNHLASRNTHTHAVPSPTANGSKSAGPDRRAGPAGRSG
jgi:hypothetical protein